MRKMSLTTMTTIAIGVTVVLLVHIGMISVGQCFRRLEDTNLSQQRLSVLTVLKEVKYSLAQLQGAEHSFVYSGDERYVQVYDAEKKRLDRLVEELDMRL